MAGMKKPLYLLLVSMLCGAAAIAEDSVSVKIAPDTIKDPEWYVAPINAVSWRAPRRDAAVISCPIDSLLTFDTDSMLTEVSVYEYDEAGRIVGTTVWACNADGSRVGRSRNEYAFDPSGAQIYTATYDWDETTNDWRGLSKSMYLYENGLMTSNTSCDWQNNAWSANTQYTYAYDEAGREIEYVYYIRNATSQQLSPSKSRVRQYDVSANLTLEIQYTAHDGTAWSAGTKSEFAYDTQGNQIEKTYHASFTNGVWKESTHEVWTYNAQQLNTYYKKETYSDSQWATTVENIYDYTAGGDYLLIEKYSLKSGVLAGTSKQVYEYNASGLQTSLISYKWTNGAWVNSTWTVTGYDEADNKAETCKYTWKNNQWTGSGKRVLKTYNAKKKVIDQITQTWPANATDWVNSERVTAAYNAKSKKTQEASYTWTNNQWEGIIRTDWHYNSANQNDTIMVYEPNGTDWKYNNRTVNTFDAKGNIILSHTAFWDDAVWVMLSMTRAEIRYEGAKQVSNASYACGQDSVWYGVQKDSTAYSATGKTIFSAQFSWGDGEWVMASKAETTYDDADRQTAYQSMKWNGLKWVGETRRVSMFDEQGRETLNATYTGWNSSTDNWVGNNKIERTYENNQETALVIYGWGTDDWLPQTRFSFAYDNAGNEILQTAERYENGVWNNANKYEKEYRDSTLVKNNSYVWLNGQWMFFSRNESYYDEDAPSKLRREITGTWNSTTGALQSFADNRYFYACDPKENYTVTWLSDDGALIEETVAEAGTMPAHADINKESTAQYTFAFKGWSPVIEPVSGNATYTAVFDSIVNTYTVTFYFEDGITIMDQATVAYGETPSTRLTPSKASDERYYYTFAGWTPEIVPVTGEASYTATYTAVEKTPTGVSDLQSDDVQCTKVLIDGQIFILRGGKMYTLQGAEAL